MGATRATVEMDLGKVIRFYYYFVTILTKKAEYGP